MIRYLGESKAKKLIPLPTQKIFRHKICCDKKKIFGQKFLFGSIVFFGQKLFSDQKFYWEKFFFLDQKFLFGPKNVLDQTSLCVPRKNVAWTYVFGKVLPRVYSNNRSIGNKHNKISQNHLHLFVRVLSNSRKFLGLYTLKQGVC